MVQIWSCWAWVKELLELKASFKFAKTKRVGPRGSGVVKTDAWSLEYLLTTRKHSYRKGALLWHPETVI